MGTLRWVRDVLRMNGLIILEAPGKIIRIILSKSDPFSKELYNGLAPLLAQWHIAITLGEI